MSKSSCTQTSEKSKKFFFMCLFVCFLSETLYNIYWAHFHTPKMKFSRFYTNNREYPPLSAGYKMLMFSFMMEKEEKHVLCKFLHEGQNQRECITYLNSDKRVIRRDDKA